MRPFIASAIGALCAVGLAVTPALSAARGPSTAAPGGEDVPSAGGVHTLPLRPLATARAAGPAVRGVPAQSVEPFSLLGVTWDDAGEDLHGAVRVRTRDAGTGTWSEWQEVQTHRDDAPDPVSAERAADGVRGGTAPLWVGPSDGVQVRVVPAAARHAHGNAHAHGDARAESRRGRGGRSDDPLGDVLDALPDGMRLDLIDPGGYEPGPPSGSGDRDDGPQEDEWSHEDDDPRDDDGTAPRPGIVTRSGWGADESIRESGYAYTDTVRAAFVHHSGTGNDYSCDEAPSVVRSIYRYHVQSNGWRDVGYNFFVDKCGTIYEGRAGGVTRAVQGAHVLGFNTDTMGVAVLGTYSSARPTADALDGVAKLTAWKLGLYGRDAGGRTTLVSGGNGKYPKGERVSVRVISGHRDGFSTDCPGAELYNRLDRVRDLAADLQGR
ncbi:N-acetylmuramoyl-L-alanine amidase [Streptomyces sp. NPDC059506]|uniref:N-acetylmuramoyl-L-alanine amidase n=1 Tax=Streptomyces sp. NPDC059506 TaxID=3347751 RepID=UPI0036C28527